MPQPQYTKAEHAQMAEECLKAIRSSEIFYFRFSTWEREFWFHKWSSGRTLESFGTSKAEIYKFYILWNTDQAQYYAKLLNTQCYSESREESLRTHLQAARLTLESVEFTEEKLQALRQQYYKDCAMFFWDCLTKTHLDLPRFTRLIHNLQTAATKANQTLDELGITKEKLNKIRLRQLHY